MEHMANKGAILVSKAPLGDIPASKVPLGDILVSKVPLGDIPVSKAPLGDIKDSKQAMDNQQVTGHLEGILGSKEVIQVLEEVIQVLEELILVLVGGILVMELPEVIQVTGVRLTEGSILKCKIGLTQSTGIDQEKLILKSCKQPLLMGKGRIFQIQPVN